MKKLEIELANCTYKDIETATQKHNEKRKEIAAKCRERGEEEKAAKMEREWTIQEFAEVAIIMAAHNELTEV
jgi:hypothetical protein